MHMKITMRYYLTPFRMAIIKKTFKKKGQYITSVGEDVEKKEPLCTAGGNVNWCGHSGRWYGGSSKT